MLKHRDLKSNSEDDEPIVVEVKPHPQSVKMSSFQKVGTIEKRRLPKKDAKKEGPRCPLCLEKTESSFTFVDHIRECGKVCAKTWPFT